MINFRFHIISLVAVFLALAIGIFLGSAVGQPTIVNNLNRTIDNVRNRSNALGEENAELQRENDRLQTFINRTAAFTVQNRLGGLDVVVVAERGVDRGTVNATRDLLRTADANAPIVVWLERRWELDDADDIDRLATLLDTTTTNADILRRQAFDALARRLSRTPATSTTGTVDVLRSLVDAKFVSVDGLDENELASFPIGRASAVVVDGQKSDIEDPSIFSECVAAFATQGRSTVAAEIGSDTTSTAVGVVQRGDIVAVIRGDSELDRRVSTVDDLDLTEGRVATVLALQETIDSPNGAVGDYGYGRGASKPMPEPPTQ